MHSVGGEIYYSYVPLTLPVAVNLGELYALLERVTKRIGQLNGAAKLVPNVSLFLHMYVRREAVLSSQIEGTKSSLNDLILFENSQRPTVSLEDVGEVSNYVKALSHGLDRIKNGFVLSLRLMGEIHGILLRGIRGQHSLPGEFRRSQNWIGGSRPGNAFFVPPAPEDMIAALHNLEQYMHDESVPLLIRSAVVHLQFETIHPFLDGNGRMGRLLIILMLCNFGLLDSPILYPSLFLKERRHDYYALLTAVRERGNWEDWLKFFLEAIDDAAAHALQIIGAANDLFFRCREKICRLGRSRFAALGAFECLKKMPQTSAHSLGRAIHLSPPTARSALKSLQSLGIVEEISGKQRNRVYVFRHYLDLIS